MIDRKLGKSPATFSKKTLKLASYIDTAKLPPLPDADDNFVKLSRMTMAGNSDYGDCVMAGASHMIQVWSSMAAREVVLPDKTVIDTYLKLTGGQDTGLNVLSFLTWWWKNPIAGHPLAAFVSVDPGNITNLKYGIHLFGGIFTGIELPISAQQQKVWDVPGGGIRGDGAVGSWGGHLTMCGAYDKQANLINYTWGEKQPMTDGFVQTYVDEAYVLLALDWFGKDHKTPDGFAYKDLLSDAGRIRKG